MARILLVSYSQTGQLTTLAENFIQPLRNQQDIQIEHLQLEPEQPFPFPWGFTRFFNTFPETVHLQPTPIKTPHFQHEKAKQILKDTPVITLIGCRNMWLQAQEKVKMLLQTCGAKLIGNVVKVDQSNDWASFITTPMWMLTGKKKAYDWLPSAGIAESEMQDVQRFGNKLLQIFQQNQPLDQSIFRNMQAVKIDEKLMMSEKVGARSFYLWGKLLIKCGQISPYLRQGMLYFYIVFLIAMIVTVVPISALIKRLLKPLIQKKLEQQKKYFAEPSGE